MSAPRVKCCGDNWRITSQMPRRAKARTSSLPEHSCSPAARSTGLQVDDGCRTPDPPFSYGTFGLSSGGVVLVAAYPDRDLRRQVRMTARDMATAPVEPSPALV